jgi:16S rRNA (cytidine1402-2'-O)-methyltransferase
MDVALVTDAGTPLVSDPGFELVKQAIAKDIRVIPIPGPSAVVTALMGAGINADRFVFLGFLPKKDKQRQELLNKYRSWEFAIVVYESPNRVKETLRDMQQILGERNICIGRELTKMHEEFVRGPIAQVLKSLENKDVLGEVVMVIEGKEINEVKWDETMIVAKIKENLIKELPVNLLAKEIAKETGWNKSDVYKIILKIKK